MVIEKKNSNDSTRRDFIRFFLLGGFLTWVVSVFYIIIRFFSPLKSEEIEVVNEVILEKNVKDFRINSSIIFPFGDFPAILIRKKNGKFVAYFATCTHLGCTVQYQPLSKNIVCACHMGIFDITGKNIEGPPTKPLLPLRVQIDLKRRIHIKRIKTKKT